MSNQVQTPPYRRISDWYRITIPARLDALQPRLHATDPTVRKTGYGRAKVEIDELLRSCWSMLEPLPLEIFRRKDREVREFISKTVLVAALDLKALIEVGLDDFAGLDEGLSLTEVNRRLRKGKHVTPLTIVEAILRERENPSALLLLDLACFFHLSKNDARAGELAEKAYAAAPDDKRDLLRARAAEDPMLKGIPAISSAKPSGAKHRCQWPKREPEESQAPPRSWF